MSKHENYIDVEKLKIGIYVIIELHWNKHPFFFSRFKIKSWDEIRQIQSLGLTRIAYEPLKCDIQLSESTEAPVKTSKKANNKDLWQAKEDCINSANNFREERRRAAYRYHETKKKVKNLTNDLVHAPANAIRDSEELVSELTEMFSKADSDVVINLVNLSSSDFNLNSHALNVTVLSLLVANQLGMIGDELKTVGIAALLHDIGKVMVPTHILKKKSKSLTKPEIEIVKTHVGHGVKLVQRAQNVPHAVIEVIAHHHCYLDGSGYPSNVPENRISKNARIVTIANLYDRICNPIDSAEALTPKEAMAKLYAVHTKQLDPNLVQLFIKTFGVYPPGAVVLLTDDSIALVIAVNSKNLLEPRVIIYNPDIPPNQALMVELDDYPDLKIQKALRPNEYPQRVYDYLGIKENVGYYVDTLIKQPDK